MTLQINSSFEKALADYRKELLGGDYPIIWSFYCDPEKFWAKKRNKTIASSQRVRILNNLDESALWLAQEQDYVILQDAPSESYLRQIPGLKIKPDHFLLCKSEKSGQDLPLSILSDAALHARIDEINRENFRVGYLPFGNTPMDQQFAEKFGLVMMTASVDIAIDVNTKIYSRNLCNGPIKFPSIPGFVCSTPEEIRSAYQKLTAANATNIVVVKDPNGVSGKGIFTFQCFSELNVWLQFQESKNGLLPEYVVEQWIPSSYGFNHSFLLFPNGKFVPLAIKKSLINRGRHRAHLDPIRFNSFQQSIISSCQSDVATHLHRNGYFGFVGIDGIIANDNQMFPLVEINARVNWSAAQLSLKQYFSKDIVFKATEMPFTISSKKIRSDTQTLLRVADKNSKDRGVIVQLERPLHVNCGTFDTVESSLFCIIYGSSMDEVAILEQEVQFQIEEFQHHA